METGRHRSRKANNCYNEFQQNKTNNKVSVCMLKGYIHSNHSRKNISLDVPHLRQESCAHEKCFVQIKD